MFREFMGINSYTYYSDIMSYEHRGQLEELMDQLKKKAEYKISTGELALTPDWDIIAGHEAEKFMVEECLPFLKAIIREVENKDRKLRKVLSQLEQLAKTYKK